MHIAKTAQPFIKLKKFGAHSMHNDELLQIVLHQDQEYQIKNKKEPPQFLERIMSSSQSEIKLTALSEISVQEALQITKDFYTGYKIVALGELFKRYNREKRGGYIHIIHEPKQIFEMFVDELSTKKQEHFYTVLLDTKNRVIGKVLISVGTLNASLVHPREVFREAIRQAAHSIITVHNHPSGDPTPSPEDTHITEELMKIGELLRIKLLDHVIIGAESYYAFSSSDIYSFTNSKNVK
ncbi:MAG: JAB domain-containing protein [Candidatus Woesearchaeota archaeon]